MELRFPNPVLPSLVKIVAFSWLKDDLLAKLLEEAEETHVVAICLSSHFRCTFIKFSIVNWLICFITKASWRCVLQSLLTIIAQ